MIAQAIAPLDLDPDVQMSTLRRPITDASERNNPNVVKVAVDLNGDALYFSRSPLPYLRGTGPTFKHIGLYAYRRRFLLTLTSLPQTPLEKAESLEQLRALEHGFRIRTVETLHESVEVDTPKILNASGGSSPSVRAHEARTMTRPEGRPVKYIFVTGGVVSSR